MQKISSDTAYNLANNGITRRPHLIHSQKSPRTIHIKNLLNQHARQEDKIKFTRFYLETVNHLAAAYLYASQSPYREFSLAFLPLAIRLWIYTTEHNGECFISPLVVML